MADDTNADEPKKTETLEIRLSPELKEALRENAGAEGRTVSVVLRGLIDGYLAQARRPRSLLMEAVMFFRHPIRLLAVAVVGLSVALIGHSKGVAQDLSIEIELNTWSYDAAPPPGRPDVGRKVHSLRTSVTASYGGPSSFTISSGEAAGLVLDVTPEPVDAESFLLHVTLRETDGDASKVVATPVLQARFGDEAEIRSGDDLHGYELQILGEKLS